MNVLTGIILAFSALGAVDWLIGNKIGVGKEFERAFLLFGPLALSMLGMIVIAPAVGVWLSPLFDGFYALFGIDPSIIPASLLANDMGGGPLAVELTGMPSMSTSGTTVTVMPTSAHRAVSRAVSPSPR